MTAYHYYEAHGALKDKFHQYLERLQAGHDRAFEFAKEHGAAGLAFDDSLGHPTIYFGQFRKPPDPKLWRQHKHSNPPTFRPRLGTKAGRDLDDLVQSLSLCIPCNEELNRFVSLPRLRPVTEGGFGVRVCRVSYAFVTAQAADSDQRDAVLVRLPDFYKPPRRLKDQLVRISDLEFEERRAQAERRDSKRKTKSKPKR